MEIVPEFRKVREALLILAAVLSRGGRKLFWTGRKPHMVHSVCVPPLDLAVEPLKNSVGQILAVLEGRKSFS